MNRKLKLLIEYEGTQYHGWQVQSNGITIQEILQATFEKITRRKSTVIASGRTDAGVHAEGQVAHISTPSKLSCRELLMGLNGLLPRDIAVLEVVEAAADFHAQKSAVRKIYRYTILNRPYPSAMNYRRSLFIQSPLNIASMKRAAKYLQGRHDFSAFRASNCSARSPIRELFKVEITNAQDFIYLHFDGDGFLKHMVRNLVGTLIQVGRGTMKPKQVLEILESRNRNKAGPTAQPHGLCLVKVIYDE